MNTIHTYVGLRRAWLVLFASLATGCIESVRVPLAVPLAPLGGSRPAAPQGIHLGVEFGDGVWGQEQERAEMAGGVFGFSVGDRVEILATAHNPTRTVRDSGGHEHTGEATDGIRAKVRLGDFREGRASVAVHFASMRAARERLDEQDERLSAVDLAVPVEFYPVGGPLVDYRFGIFAAPRLTFQSFEDRLARETTTGTMVSGVVGLVGRWRYFAVSGELNFARTPTMTFGDATFDSGFHMLPVMGVRGIIPIGD
jgi:hypothetical protein